MDELDAVRSLSALAQGARLRIYRALVGSAPGGLTPGALSSMLGIPPSTLSFHLKELASAGLVSQQREGRSLIYRAALERIDALLAYLTAHCCHVEDAGHCTVAGRVLGCGDGEAVTPAPSRSDR